MNFIQPVKEVNIVIAPVKNLLLEELERKVENYK